MKNTAIICLSLLAGFSANAQKIKSENVPATVSQSLNKLYPNLVSVRWKLEEGNYEALFKKDNTKKEVIFSSDGKLIQTETELSSPNDLPQSVLATLKKDFAGFRFEDAEKIETADGKTQYKVEAGKMEAEYELLYDDKGSLVKKTEEKGEEKGHHWKKRWKKE